MMNRRRFVAATAALAFSPPLLAAQAQPAPMVEVYYNRS